jgi:cytochrome oxidase Cu insertion factor (SCO1/SenC/PrrC family)
MKHIRAALTAVPTCALSLALVGFSAPATAGSEHSGNTSGHGQDHVQTHDNTTAMQGHGADHGTDDAAADHRMPLHLAMDGGNGAEVAMRTDGYQYQRTLNDYHMSDVTLRDSHARKVNFAELMAFDGPVLLNFVFTSCATICPVMTATFGQTQEDLVAIDENYLMVSISIDPEYDTPRRLRDYAKLHDARDNWVLLTGQFDDIFTVVRDFDAVYKGENKMYHRPLTFLRKSGDAPWLRLEGLLSSEELADEYAAMLRPEVN